MAFIKIKFASKIFLAFLSLSVILQSIASAELLSNGLPPHSLGYADKHGYLLYTDKLFDLHLTNPDSEGNEYIPIRIAFYTSPLYRKSMLLDAYWSFPIFDSYIAKADKNLICWQTLDLNIVKFRPSKDKDVWETYGGYKKLRLLKNGDYSIEWKNSDTSEQLIYAPNGLLKKISFKIKGKAYAYNIYRTKDSLIIRDLRMKTVFQIEKRPSSQDGFKSEITLKSGENLFVGIRAMRKSIRETRRMKSKRSLNLKDATKSLFSIMKATKTVQKWFSRRKTAKNHLNGIPKTASYAKIGLENIQSKGKTNGIFASCEQHHGQRFLLKTFPTGEFIAAATMISY